MAQIGASDVTYTLVEGSQFASPSNPQFSAIFTVAFGNGTLTYTGGGIPLTKAKLGCPATIRELYIINESSGDGFQYKYNHTANSIQMYQMDSHTHKFIMAGGVTTTADFLYHSSGAIGKAAATNVTIAGTSAATTGGVELSTAAALDELATTAVVAATTLRMRVVGY
jgi:hypothetical protein